MNLNKKLTFIDLFAGCGGLSQGLENAGFFPIYVNELNADAIETYLMNRDDDFPHLRKKYNSRDIKDVIKDEKFFDNFLNSIKRDFQRDFRKNPIDLVTGGPPCQGFSGIGIRRSYSVDKVQLPSNHLYQDMAFFVHKIRPKLFLFENVEGLLRSKWTKDGMKGEIFQDVLETFKSIPDYEIRTKLIHAKDYGVPQNRPRILIVGKHVSVKGKFSEDIDAVEAGYLPKPTGEPPNLADVLSDLIDPAFKYGGETKTYKKEPRSGWQKDIRRKKSGKGVLAKGEQLTEQEYSKHSDTVIERFTHMIKNDGEIPPHLKTKKFAQRLLPKQWGAKGPSITACSLADDFVHYAQARTPTVREWARLQTFPDWYQFAGKRTTGGLRRAGNPRESIFDREVPKYTQIGNAVPVKLAEQIGLHFKNILDKA